MIDGTAIPIDRVLQDLAWISVEGDPWEPTDVQSLHDDEGLDFPELEVAGVTDVQKKVAAENVLIVRWTAPLNVHDPLLYHHFEIITWVDGATMTRSYTIRSRETLPS